jgi:hypothetical protein
MSGDYNWREYTNGNVRVFINVRDGTKIRTTEDDEFYAVFPESVDMKITDRCGMGCAMCHEGSTENGEHVDLSDPGKTFMSTMRPYTEIAIGGGSVTSHPQIESFLKYLKDKEILANITVHEKELLGNISTIKKWIKEKLVKGIGISIHSEFNEKICKFAEDHPNAVLHAIAGHTPVKVIERYGNKDLKLLLLGYKNWGRGKEYHTEHENEINEGIKETEENIGRWFRTFKVVSFDNLALSQLNVKEHVSERVWVACYQGSDATHTMYIDMVKKEFAATSTSAERYEIKETIDKMFNVVKGTMDHLL